MQIHGIYTTIQMLSARNEAKSEIIGTNVCLFYNTVEPSYQQIHISDGFVVLGYIRGNNEKYKQKKK